MCAQGFAKDFNFTIGHCPKPDFFGCQTSSIAGMSKALWRLKVVVSNLRPNSRARRRNDQAPRASVGGRSLRICPGIWHSSDRRNCRDGTVPSHSPAPPADARRSNPALCSAPSQRNVPKADMGSREKVANQIANHCASRPDCAAQDELKVQLRPRIRIV